MVSHEQSSNLLSTGEVARLLHLHINTVRRWSKSGIIESRRFGSRGDRRFSWDDINRLLNQQTIP
jgi:excisionase family DNA binding protein